MSGPSWLNLWEDGDELLGLILAAQPPTALTVAMYLLSMHDQKLGCSTQDFRLASYRNEA